jgi:hypothetical protein
MNEAKETHLQKYPMHWDKYAQCYVYDVPATGYECEDCAWAWPLSSAPSDDAECDNCGGPLVESPFEPPAPKRTNPKQPDV